MAGFLIHLITYLAVCGFLTVLWALTAGSFAEVSRIARNLTTDPGVVEELGFWPIWVWLSWGVAVVVHFGVAFSGLVSGRGRRRRRRRREAERAAFAASARPPGPQGAPVAVPAPAGEPRAQGPERRWVTVMFTDLAQSTRLTETLGDEEWSRLLRKHREFVRRAFVARSGQEVGTQGDGFLARFPTPAEAVLCGVDIQRGHREWPESDALRIKIGIHAGEAVEDDGDLVGRVVNVAARVASEAQPGEILVTETVAEYLGGRLDFEDRGVRELRGVSQPRHLLAVVWSGERSPTGAAPEGP